MKDRLKVLYNAPKQALKAQMKLEALLEEMRVLYAALTRAREKLIMTRSGKNIEKAVTGWCARLENNSLKISEYQI